MRWATWDRHIEKWVGPRRLPISTDRRWPFHEKYPTRVAKQVLSEPSEMRCLIYTKSRKRWLVISSNFGSRRKQSQPEAVAEALVNLSISLLHVNSEADAVARRKEAISIYERIENQAALADLQERWSIACQSIGRPDEAIAHAESAIEILRQKNLPGIRALKRRIEHSRRTRA
jgi:tetratricopeptide (TPR) repeat protein